jgi:hypothetical protein
VRFQIIHHNISVSLIITNKHSGVVAGEKRLTELLSIANLVPYFSVDFIFFLSSHLLLSLGSLGSTFIYLKLHPKAEALATRNFRSYLTSGHELRIRLVEMIMKQSFLGAIDENSSLHLGWTGTEEMKQERA